MKYLSFVLPIGLSLGLWGCGRNLELDPPAGGEVIPIRMKIPEGLSPRTVDVIYRSNLCTRTGYSASGKRYQRDGYQSLQLVAVLHEQTGLYEAYLPKDGGGDCQWRLSNVTFGVRHANPKQFGENVSYGAGGGVIVIFDDHNSPRGPANLTIEGDVEIVEQYYPWLNEAFIDGHRKHISLLAEGDIYLMYKALYVKEVFFNLFTIQNYS